MSALSNRLRHAVRRTLASTRLYRLAPDNPGYLGVVLMFHRVIPDDHQGSVLHSRQFMVTTRGLERCVEHFRARGYRFIALDQIPEELAAGAAGEPRPPFAVVTFDDGFRDNLDLALPLLRRQGVPFAIYVCSGVPDGLWVVWPYVLDRLVVARPRLAFEWEGRTFDFATRTPRERNDAYALLRAQIINLGESDRRALLLRIADGSGLDPAAACRDLSLSWDDLRRLAADPLVTLGAHTVSHVELAAVSPERARAEIEDGRRRLAEQLGRPIAHFAYPFGSKPRPEAGGHGLVESLGFTTAVTTLPGHLTARHRNHLFQLPRHNVEDSQPPAVYETRLKAALDRLQRRPTEFALG